MAHILADLRAKQKSLKAEAEEMLAKADKEDGGELTAEQNDRLTAIKGELADLDTKVDAEVAKLEPAADQRSVRVTETVTFDDGVATAAEASVEDKVKAAIAADRQRASDIRAACALAGMPNLAEAFVNSEKNVADVVREITAKKAGASSTEIITANPGGRESAHNPKDRAGPSASEVYATRQKARNERIAR